MPSLTGRGGFAQCDQIGLFLKVVGSIEFPGDCFHMAEIVGDEFD